MRQRFAWSLMISFAALGPVWGLEILGPDSTPAFHRAAWKAKATASQTVSWGISPRGIADIQQVGDEILVWAPPGRYELELLAVGPSQDPVKPFTLERVYRQVTIGGEGPPAPVPPVPPAPIPPVPPDPDKPPKPEPAPILPAGKFGLAAKSLSWASGLDAPARARAQLVAANYRNVAAAIRKANAGDPLHNVPASIIPRSEVIALTTGGNDGQGNTWGNVAAIGQTNWVPFFKSLQSELSKLDLKTDSDLIIAWEEIATGLEAVK